jgi:hypothetical protein
MNGLENLTQAQMLALLRQQYGQGVGAFTSTQTPNASNQAFDAYWGGQYDQGNPFPQYDVHTTAANAPGLTFSRYDPTAVLAQNMGPMGMMGQPKVDPYYQAALTGDFDPSYEGGEYGGYYGIFNDDGSLRDIEFKKAERTTGGWIHNNLDTIGPLVVGGAAALGGGLFAGLGGAAEGAGTAGWTSGYDLAGGGALGGSAAPITASTPSWIAGAGSTVGMTPAQIEAAQVAAGIGTAGAPLAGGLSAADLARYAGAAGSLLPLATGPGLPAATQTPAVNVPASTDALNALFGNREDIYKQVYDNAYGLSSGRLNEKRENTLRDLRFGLARTGLTGGSAAVDTQGLEQREFGRALMDASNSAQGQADQVKANDERTRLSLIAQMRAGMTSADATQSALAQMSDNVNTAKAQQPYSAADAYMAAISPTVNQYQINQGIQRARNTYPGLAGEYRGTIVR